MIDIHLDTTLDPSITPEGVLSKKWSNPEAIFLTGATGLVGPHLLSALLRKTAAHIYCLMRCDNEISGKERLKKHLLGHKLWNDLFGNRITVVPGDLSMPFLGMAQPLFSQIAAEVDTIYHNGATVNFMYPYDALRKPNVIGSQEVIRFAAREHVKPIHFISSVAVFFTQKNFKKGVVTETDPPEYDQSLKGGYKQSKWASEQLMLNARERGIPSVIYRPVRILGSSKTGIMDFKDTLCHLIKACIALGAYPQLDTLIEYLPADYVGDAIIHLSLQENSLNRIFHLRNPNPVSYKTFLYEIGLLGYRMREVDYDSWIKALEELATKEPQEPVYAFLRLFLKDSNNLLRQQMAFDDKNTRQGLSDGEVICPPTDYKIISTYLSYFKEKGFIP